MNLNPDQQEWYEKEVDNIQNQLYQDYIQRLLTKRGCLGCGFIFLILLLVVIFQLLGN